MGFAAETPGRGIGWLVVLAAAAVAASLVQPLIAVVAGPALLGASLVVARNARTWDARAVALVTAGLGAGLCLLVVVFVAGLRV